VLAGEIKAPGSYSLRTLDFIKNLSQQEAESIARLAPFVIDGAIYRHAQEILDAAGITSTFLMKMQQLGIIAGVEASGIQGIFITNASDEFETALISNSKALIVSTSNPKPTVLMPAYLMTDIGIQLLNLGNFEPNIEYLKEVGEHFKSNLKDTL